MNWKTAVTVLVASAALQGCIYYEGNDDDCPGCDDWDDTSDDPADDTGTSTDDTGDTADDTDTTDDTDDTEPDAIDYGLALTNPSGEQGQILITSLISTTGQDLSGVTKARFFNDLTVHATEARYGEVIMSVSVGASASIGPTDMLVEFANGTAAFAEGAFTVLEATEDPVEDPCAP